MAGRGRKALDFDEKVGNAVNADPTQAQVDLAEWLSETTGKKIDMRTLVIVQKLYPEFLKTPAAAAAAAERKAAREAGKITAQAQAQEKFLARAAKLGFKVEKVEEPDAE